MSWFVLIDGEVVGPLKEEEVKAQPKNIQVWGTELSHWVSLAAWNRHVQAVRTEDGGATASNVQSIQHKKTKAPTPQVWYYALNKERFGPFKKQELVEKLKILDVSFEETPIYLWHKGLESWQRLNEFPEILGQLVAPKAA